MYKMDQGKPALLKCCLQPFIELTDLTYSLVY